ncbi:molecular chaperone [Paraburkholderia sp.]|uniref:fimbrial biogenesis chaperone n=1 Tax=Paraburkholderia sp. TaxID=1926495 RepID=UPI002386669E|nr:molecular chaperone [Paraburkholderia sp.]MDE1182786.1 molecular chaperone [Paraburkholderia sp.]
MTGLRTLLLAVCTLAMTLASAHGATLQISPVMVDLPADSNASGLTLRNPGDKPLYGQVRVYRWDQENGEDTLTPTQDVVASPPMIQIAARSEQLVRLVRTAPPPNGAEESYRVLIDELPEADATPANGVTIRLRYSVPVFLEPGAQTGTPKLAWHLFHAGDGWELRADNTGKRRAQIAAVQLVNGAGSTFEINKGLLGYALPGRGRTWRLPLPANADLSGQVKIRAAVNATPAESVVSVE